MKCCAQEPFASYSKFVTQPKDEYSFDGQQTFQRKLNLHFLTQDWIYSSFIVIESPLDLQSLYLLLLFIPRRSCSWPNHHIVMPQASLSIEDLIEIQDNIEKKSAHSTSINGRLMKLPVRRNLDFNITPKSPAAMPAHRTKSTAGLGYRRGDVAANPCSTCALGKGRFRECVVVPGHLTGACTSCFYTANGHKCPFRTGRWDSFRVELTTD